MAGRESNHEAFSAQSQELLKKARIKEERTFISKTAYEHSDCRVKLIFDYQQIVLVTVIILLSGCFVTTVACSKRISQSNLQKNKSLYQEKESLTPIEKKISSQLLHAINMKQNPPEKDVTHQQKTLVEIDDDGRIMVDIKAYVTPELVLNIENIGGTIIHSSEKYNRIRARIHLDQIKAVAAMQEVQFIRPAIKAVTH